MQNKIRFTANVIPDQHFFLDIVATELRAAGFDVEEVPAAHGLVVQREAETLEDFLQTIEAQFAAWEEVGGFLIDDYGETA